jgi:hypothetical protein
LCIDPKLESVNAMNFGASDERQFADIKDNNNKKRKPKGTLVNPYIKKRKVQGAKF